MSNKRHKPEEIVTKFRQVEVLVGQGMARIDTDPRDRCCRADVLPLAEAVWRHGQGSGEGPQTSPKRESMFAAGNIGRDPGQVNPV